MPTPSYPNFAGKHAGQALFTAADFLAYLRQAGALALLANSGNSSAGRALVTSREFCSWLELSLNPAAH